MIVICPRCGKKINSKSNIGATRCNRCSKSIIFDYEKHRKWTKEYRLKNRDKANEYARQWAINNPEAILRHARKKYRNQKNKLKQGLLKILGEKCIVCGEKNECCLDIHHKNGEKENSSYLRKTSSIKRYKEYVKTPENLVLLCANCHRKLHNGLISLE